MLPIVIPKISNVLFLALGPGVYILPARDGLGVAFLVVLALSAFDAMFCARTTWVRVRPSGLLILLALSVYTLGMGVFQDLTFRHRRFWERMAFSPQVYRMGGHEMGPAVHYLDDYLVDIWSRQPKPGEIIVYQPGPDYAVEDQQVVARVAGLAGDRVEVKRGQLLRNQEPVEEPWRALLQHPAPGQDMPLIDVPTGHYLCLRDERWFRFLTAYWELVPQERILGKVVLIIDSVDFERIGLDPMNPQRVR